MSELFIELNLFIITQRCIKTLVIFMFKFKLNNQLFQSVGNENG